MIIQAEVSFYPLKESDIAADINDFIHQLAESGLEVERGRMSSIVTGELSPVLDAVKEAYQKISANKQSVLIVKISNACPLADRRK